MTQHEANTDDRKCGRSIARKLRSVGNEAWKFEPREEERHAKHDGDNIRILDNAVEKFSGKFAFEKENAIGKERDIESDNKATIWHDPLLTEDARNNRIAEKGSVIKDECELRFEAKLAFVKMFIKNDATSGNEREHHDNAGGKAFEEKIGSFFIELARKSNEQRSWHKDGQEQINEAFVSLGVDEFCFAQNEAKNENNRNRAEARVEKL